MQTRAGMVAIIGMPNAGKSSLLNRLIDTKLSIVTPAAQTTRERVVGIDTRDGVQMVFIDTPGIVDPAYLLHRSMLHIVEETITDADVVVLLLDGSREQSALSGDLEGLLRRKGDALIPAINKIDVASPATLSQTCHWAAAAFGRNAVPISARTAEGLDELRSGIAERLPISPFLYPDEDISTQTIRFFVAELVRETIFERYQDEIPYSAAVRVEEYREDADPVFIRAVVYVERPSQKGILIGRGGASIRELGVAARVKIEEFVGARVYLDLWVKVLPRWRKSALELARLGFPIPDDKEN